MDARTATIDDLVVRNTIQSPNADIAYHLRIEDEEICAELEEGDIVGFFTDKEDGGTYIKRLVSSDMDDAVHAGVVSRSYYLAANKQEGTTRLYPYYISVYCLVSLGLNLQLHLVCTISRLP